MLWIGIEKMHGFRKWNLYRNRESCLETCTSVLPDSLDVSNWAYLTRINQMRSAVEKQLDLIALGKANFKSVLKHTLEVFKLKFMYFVKVRETKCKVDILYIRKPPHILNWFSFLSISDDWKYGPAFRSFFFNLGREWETHEQVRISPSPRPTAQK